jgi:uncharacterized protein (DUF983 family)
MSTTVVPVIINSGSDAEDHCPGCGKGENIVEVCKHCGYEYKDEDDAPWTWKDYAGLWTILVGVLVFAWAVVTCVYWMDNRNTTLVGVIQSQGQWFVELKGRIK